MSIITIILFFIYTYGLGFSITYFLKGSDNFFERNIMGVGVGLGVIPLLGIILNFLHIPIDWKIVLLLSLVIPIFSLVRSMKKGFKIPNIKLTKSTLYFLVVLLIFSLTLFMYLKGSFRYPYLEDDDPWAYAAGIKYISIEKDIVDIPHILRFVRPYPPGYSLLMGILHQTSPSLMWTMKFFNALIISLGIIFFYFFTKDFMGNKQKALFATIILAMVPCYLSHFIWAHSFAVTLLIVALYCLVMIDWDKKWVYPSIFVIASIPLTQPTQAIKMFIILMIYFVIKAIYSKKFFVRESIAIIGGYLLSVLWWARNWRGMLLQRRILGVGEVSEQAATNIILRSWNFIKHTFPYDQGTATRPYTFGDFFIAKSQNMINNPIGVGFVLCLIVIFSLILIFATYKSMKAQKKMWVMINFFWLVFTFLGINSMTFKLPVGLFAFRFWMLFAIPLSIMAAEGFWFIVQFLKKVGVPKIATIALLVLLIFFTSGKQKYAVNTAMWGPGQMWTSMDEVMGYTWLKTLPVDTKVFDYSGDEQVIGFDKFSCLWCDDVIEFRKDLLYKNTSEVYSWLKRQRYEYLIFGGRSYKNFNRLFGENETNKILPKRLEEINSFDKFQIVHQTKGAVIFKVS